MSRTVGRFGGLPVLFAEAVAVVGGDAAAAADGAGTGGGTALVSVTGYATAVATGTLGKFLDTAANRSL